MELFTHLYTGCTYDAIVRQRLTDWVNLYAEAVLFLKEMPRRPLPRHLPPI